MRQLAKGAADAVVFAVVGGLLDGISAEDGGFAVGIIGGVGCEIDFAE